MEKINYIIGKNPLPPAPPSPAEAHIQIIIYSCFLVLFFIFAILFAYLYYKYKDLDDVKTNIKGKKFKVHFMENRSKVFAFVAATFIVMFFGILLLLISLF